MGQAGLGSWLQEADQLVPSCQGGGAPPQEMGIMSRPIKGGEWGCSHASLGPGGGRRCSTVDNVGGPEDKPSALPSALQERTTDFPAQVSGGWSPSSG